MASDVCKHCTHAACLDVCPTGAIFRTEFGTVVVQQDICNGCGYCVPACPYGVLDKREDDGRIFKCTLCYDRLSAGQEPACAKACPTDSIQFGELEELRERAAGRVEQLHEAGVAEARLYGHDPDDGVGGDGAFFLLLDEPEVYGLPPDPVVTTRDLPAHVDATSALAAGGAAGRRSGRVRAGADVEQRGRTSRSAARDGATPPASHARRTRLLLRQADHQAAGVGGARHRRLPVRRRAGRGVLGRRRRRRPDRPRDTWRAAAKLRASAAIGVSLVGARPRPRSPGALPEHAARVQADLADEHRRVDPRRLRRRSTASPPRSDAARPRAAQRACRGRCRRRCSAPASPPTPPP